MCLLWNCVFNPGLGSSVAMHLRNEAASVGGLVI